MKKFSEWIGTIREAEKIKESDKQEAYQKFFMSKLKEYGVSSPAELDDEKKKKFFDEISAGWDEDQGAAKNESTEESDEETNEEEPKEEETNEEEVKSEEPEDEEKAGQEVEDSELPA